MSKKTSKSPEEIALRALWAQMKEDGILDEMAEDYDCDEFVENVTEIFRKIK